MVGGKIQYFDVHTKYNYLQAGPIKGTKSNAQPFVIFENLKILAETV